MWVSGVWVNERVGGQSWGDGNWCREGSLPGISDRRALWLDRTCENVHVKETGLVMPTNAAARAIVF